MVVELTKSLSNRSAKALCVVLAAILLVSMLSLSCLLQLPPAAEQLLKAHIESDTTVSLSASSGKTFQNDTSWQSTFQLACGSTKADQILAHGLVGMGDSYHVFRTGIIWDTSTLPDNAIITNASISIYVTDKGAGHSTENSVWNIVVQRNTTGAKPSTAWAYTDYNKAYLPTSTIGYKPHTALTLNAWNSIWLNSSVYPVVNTSGDTRVMLRSSNDYTNVAPAATYYYTQFWLTEPSYFAKLVVVYHTPTALTPFHPGPLESYWTLKNDTSRFSFDSNGVIKTKLNGVFYYQPYWIAHFAAAAYYNFYHANKSIVLNDFRNQIAWLRNNETVFGNHSIWYYDFDNPWGDPNRDTNPFWSALSNGFGIAAMLESYALDGIASDLSVAWRALLSYRCSLSDHGFATIWTGTIWFEEEADNSTPILATPSHILNGFMLSLECINYVYTFNSSAYALALFNEGISSLKSHLPEFDTGLWQRYSMLSRYISSAYMIIHRDCFTKLAAMTGDSFFSDWSDRSTWMYYLASSGYVPSSVSASSSVTPGTESRLYNRSGIYSGDSSYWGGYVSENAPANITYYLGTVAKAINFIGYYASSYTDNSPRNWTLYSSNDSSTWVQRAKVINSTDYDKGILLSPGISAKYVKISISSTILRTLTIVALGELIVSNMAVANMTQFNTSVSAHRFNSTDGQLTINQPIGSIVRIDNSSAWSGNHTYYLSAGPHYLAFTDSNGYSTSQSATVIYAQSSSVTNSVETTGISIQSEIPHSFISLNGLYYLNLSINHSQMLGLVSFYLTTDASWLNLSWFNGTQANVSGVANVTGLFNVSLRANDSYSSAWTNWTVAVICLQLDYSPNLTVTPLIGGASISSTSATYLNVSYENITWRIFCNTSFDLTVDEYNLSVENGIAVTFTINGTSWFNVSIIGLLANWSYEQLINAFLNTTLDTDVNATLGFSYSNSSLTEFSLIAQQIDAPIGGDDNETMPFEFTPMLLVMAGGAVILALGIIAWRPEVMIIGGVIVVIFAFLGGYLPVVI